MRKNIIIICLLIGVVKLWAQKGAEPDKLVLYRADNTETPEFIKIDQYVLNLKDNFKSIPELANQLFLPYTAEADKVRAAFRWMTHYIAYDPKAYHANKNTTTTFTYKTEAELVQKKEKADYEYATAVLHSKKGVCEGYAALFYQLCKQAGIPCEIIEGYASMDTGAIKKIRGQQNYASNHAWNKVKIGTTWYYVDATWASGYCDKPIRHFYKKFEPYYYLTPIDRLYLTHALNAAGTKKRNANQ